MSKVAYIGDLHFGGNNYQVINKSWSTVVKECISRKVTTIIIAGDIFDSSNIASHRTPLGTIIKAFNEPLLEAVNNGITCYLLVGNHDLTSSNHEHALAYLKGLNSKIIVIDEPTTISIDSKKIGLMPWLKNDLVKSEDFTEGVADLIDETLSNFYTDCLDVFVGHVELSDYVVSGYRMTGNKYSIPEDKISGIAKSVFLGHYHKADKYYLGSLTHLTFNDVGNAHHFIIQDLTDMSKEVISVDCPEFKIINIPSVYDIPKELDNLNRYRLDIKDGVDLDSVRHLLSNNVEIKLIKEDHLVSDKELDAISLNEEDLFKEYASEKGYDEETINEVLKRLVGVK